MTSLLGSRSPIVAAPMAGGPSTAALAVAVARAGGFPFLAAGYQHPDALAAQVEAVRRHGRPFGVNLFVPSRAAAAEPAALRAYAAALAAEADRYDVTLDPTPVDDDDGWSQKLDLLVRHPVPVVSLTFGLPDAADIAALRGAGTQVLASVTTAAEAHRAELAGVDGLVVQGPDAGGHSATHEPARPVAAIATDELVRRVHATTRLPIVAAGGVDGPAAVRRLLSAGADAVAVGTLFLLADEAGTSATHRAALVDASLAATTITRAFTGRPARALRNGFVDRHDGEAPLGYPAVHHLTRALRQAANAAGDSDVAHLWAGTGWRHARPGPTADIVAWLSAAT
ncbi:nitroalkane oxidase [Jatrophihabitans endophyticus]|uniref:Propionate 3-nitronate monooxygenase n=1 Tax=Jatrophihabitans endophyticus TaxID=1206085 RepID=A0A1M5EGP7_9ACTN|nr:nitronate monooxygenase [Jatrophihabitans endophyticus]SHF78463.1 nitroalkane oxidase [Jatrophihabitans endophyticus]